MQEEPNKYVKELTQEKYKYGFTTDVHTDIIEKGLNEDVIRLISAKNLIQENYRCSVEPYILMMFGFFHCHLPERHLIKMRKWL